MMRICLIVCSLLASLLSCVTSAQACDYSVYTTTVITGMDGPLTAPPKVGDTLIIVSVISNPEGANVCTANNTVATVTAGGSQQVHDLGTFEPGESQPFLMIVQVDAGDSQGIFWSTTRSTSTINGAAQSQESSAGLWLEGSQPLPNLITVIQRWGPADQFRTGDMNYDGQVNVSDLLKVLSSW